MSLCDRYEATRHPSVVREAPELTPAEREVAQEAILARWLAFCPSEKKRRLARERERLGLAPPKERLALIPKQPGPVVEALVGLAPDTTHVPCPECDGTMHIESRRCRRCKGRRAHSQWVPLRCRGCGTKRVSEPGRRCHSCAQLARYAPTER